MDILNWLYLAKNKFVRTTIDNPKDLMIFGAKVGTSKRGDIYQNYAMEIQDFAASVGGLLEVLTTYPVTTPASAGTRFWYKGNEWHYMTQDEIDSAGWTDIVTVGFPAPVVKNYNIFIATDYTATYYGVSTNGVTPVSNTYTVIDILGLGDPTKVRSFTMAYTSSLIASIRNAKLLVSVADIGTSYGITIANGQLSATALNAFFTDLPAAVATCTILASGNPGSATCNPTIATAKGYTVIV